MFRRKLLQPAFPALLLLLIAFAPVAAQEPLLDGPKAPAPQRAKPVDGDFSQVPLEKIPADTILIKGAEPFSSDSSTPKPEDGFVSKSTYQNRYLALTYPFPQDWIEPFSGPPPSDHGTYVLTQLVPSAAFKRQAKGTVLITAQDMFFAFAPSRNAVELVAYSKEHLPSYYEIERLPTDVEIAGRRFIRFDYKSSAANLHWAVLATEIRCHTIQFVFTSQDAKLIEELVDGMNGMQLPEQADPRAGSGGGPAPRCIANYARPENIMVRTDPVLTDRRFNQIPVRLVIGKDGRVIHVHIISAFRDQADKITDAMMQWRFKPYVIDGHAQEIETGVTLRSSREARDAAKTNALTTD